MSNGKIVPVILSGGSGTRLWPLSRSLYPKQLLPLVSERTMLQDTVLRVADRERFTAPIIVCNDEHRFIIEEQLAQIGVDDATIVIEPEGHNTAPAVAAAAILVSRQIRRCAAPDHAVRPRHRGRKRPFAPPWTSPPARLAKDKLVTFGINPTRAETGYGYIEIGDGLPGHKGCHAVQRFVEKPNAAKAKELLEAGNYAWNSGLFLFSARDLFERARKLQSADGEGLPGGLRSGQVRSRVPASRSEGLRGLSVGFDRLCGDGADRERRGRAGLDGVERCRLVVVALGPEREDRQRAM